MDALNRMLYFLSYYEQNTTYYRTLVLLLENFARLPRMTIQELAEMCFVSTATVSRLIQDMGFQSYSAFREQVAAVLSAHRDRPGPADAPCTPDALVQEADSYLSAVTETLREILQPELCQTIIDVTRELKGAKNVCFLSSATQTFLQLQRMLFLDGKRATAHKVFEEGAAFAEDLQAGDVIFADINGAGEFRLKMPLLERLRRRGVVVVVNSALEEDWPALCDYVLPPFYLHDTASIFLSGICSRLIRLVYTTL